MKKALVRVLVVLGVLYLLSIVVSLIFIAWPKGRVPSKTILEADFEKELVEDVPESPTAKVMLRDREVVRDLVDALDRGADDKRVTGLVARIGSSGMGMAQAQEVRDAVLRFRGKNKFTIAFAETFGEFGPGNNAYYLATAFEQVYLQPSGDVGLTGIMLESPFLKGTLAKLGTKFHGDHRYEYKTALNVFTESKFTPAHREEDKAIIDSWFSQMKEGICRGRQISPDQFQSIVDHAPYLGKEAVAAKLVDKLAYREEVYDMAKKKAGDGTELLYLDKYLERAGWPHKKGKEIALIFGVGGVQRGKSDYDPIQGQLTMGSETVAGAIRAAAKDKDVKAILFRVDSPGGSYVASDTIWEEVVRARKGGKPVIVSMGDVAGSGGYFVAMAADKIVAQPGTITASIGVLAGKLLTTGFWNKVGLSWDEVHDGANAAMWTGLQDYSPAEWKRFEDWLDRIYDDFTTKVADGRHLPKDKILQIAKGRIWSGQDAKKLGLVDELGGYDTALKLAKESAGIPEGEEVKIVVFPQKKSLLQSILQREGPENSDKEGVAAAGVQLLQLLQPFAHELNEVGVFPHGSENQGQDALRMRLLAPSR
jgi:protease IV